MCTGMSCNLLKLHYNVQSEKSTQRHFYFYIQPGTDFKYGFMVELVDLDLLQKGVAGRLSECPEIVSLISQI